MNPKVLMYFSKIDGIEKTIPGHEWLKKSIDMLSGKGRKKVDFSCVIYPIIW
jgi:hypothetical protein